MFGSKRMYDLQKRLEALEESVVYITSWREEANKILSQLKTQEGFHQATEMNLSKRVCNIENETAKLVILLEVIRNLENTLTLVLLEMDLKKVHVDPIPEKIITMPAKPGYDILVKTEEEK